MKKIKAFLLAAFSAMLIGCTPNPAPGPGPGPGPNPNIEPAPTYDEPSVQIHYQRNDDKYDSWALWLWKFPDGAGEEYLFNGKDTFGAVASYPLSMWPGCDKTGLGFIVKSKGSWSSKDPDGDRSIDFSKFEKDSNDVYHVYLKTGDSSVYTNENLTLLDEILSAKFSKTTALSVTTSTNIVSYKVYEDNALIGEKTLEKPAKSFIFNMPEGKEASFECNYSVSVVFEASGATINSPVSLSSLFNTPAFNNAYTYEGDLGAIYTPSSTAFKVWSPVSKSIKLRIYENGTPKSVNAQKGDDTYTEYPMVKGEKGVFSAIVNGDLEGKYYTYVVTNATYTEKETVDPYALSTGVNGARGMIVDFSKTDPAGFSSIEPLQIDRKKLTVYETHVADITSSETWTNDPNIRKYEKTFKGATISGTTYTEGSVTVKTGFDHIKELGVNAVQLIPIFDQANDETNMTFNWGYNPANYNALEGGYSTDPYDGYARIREFKELVKAYNQNGMNIIMDVVYNHMNGAVGSNFDILVPGYYFRYDGAGKLSNGSGCGNETASNLPMFRKFMIDSTCFWAREYKLGGFRFDLMGLHDLDTMNQLAAKLKEINPNICIYGEPWTGGTSTLAENKSAKQVNLESYQGYGAFNDKMRDALIKGGLSAASDKGWITNTNSSVEALDMNRILSGIKGATRLDFKEINDPDKTVNYVTCHDNYTLKDRINAAGITDEDTVKKMAMLANSIVLTSNGTTFMLAGEEFLRTKGGDSNSYTSSYKVNELDYSLKIKNIDMFENYKKLIAFKQSCTAMCLSASENKAINPTSSNANQISYNIKDTNLNRTYVVVHCNGYNPSTLGTLDLTGFTLYLDTLGERELTNKTKLQPFETLIVYKNN